MKKSIMLLCITAMSAAAALPAGAVTIDGTFNLTEWAGHYAAEDGTTKNGYVGPGYGGQAYDVEYLGLKITGGTLYFGLQTGFHVKNGRYDGSLYFGPGDFAIDVDQDGRYEYAIDFTIPGSTPGDAVFTLYQVDEYAGWQKSKYSQHAVADPFQMKPGGVIVGASFVGKYGYGVYDNNKDGGFSYVLEGAFDLSRLALYDNGPITLHWTMGCGNDYLNADAVPAPEPGTFVLMGIGAFGLVAMRRGMHQRSKR